MLGLGIWSFSYGLDFCHIDNTAHYLYLIVFHSGKMLVFIGFVLSIFELTQNKRFVNQTFWILLLLSPALLGFSILLDPFASTFIEFTHQIQLHGKIQWVTETGWLASLVEIGLSLIWLGVCLYLLFEFFKKSKKQTRIQLVFIIVSIFLFLIASSTQDLGWNAFNGLDLSPVLILANAIILLFIGGYYQLTNVIPLARNTIVDELEEPVVIFDAKERVVDWNVAAETVLFHPVWTESLLPLPVFFSKYPEIYEKIASVTPKRNEFKWNWSPKQEKDEFVHWQIHLKRIKDQNLDTIGSILFFRNISDQTRAELAMKEANLSLQSANQSKDRFFSILSHDLRGPMGGIRILAQILDEKLKKQNSELTKTSKVILDAVDSVSSLLEDILQWAKLQKANDDFLPMASSVDFIVKESIQLLSVIASEKEIELINEIPSHAQVLCDERMILTVLRNLISNAIKFSLKKSRVRVFANETSESWNIGVEDQGVGMPEELQKKLFRADEVIKSVGTQGEKGNGLGLILCSEFVKLHKGKISVQSEPGKGSIFTVSLPKAQSSFRN